MTADTVKAPPLKTARALFVIINNLFSNIWVFFY